MQVLPDLQIIAQRRSVAKNVGCFRRDLFVCVWVCGCACQHDNFRMSKHMMMKLVGGEKVHPTKISVEFEFGGHSPPPGCATPKNVAFC